MGRRCRNPWVAVGVVASMLGSPVRAISAAVASPDLIEIPKTYMVEFMDGYDVRDFYNELGHERIEVQPRVNFTYRLFQGASFTLSPEEVEEGATAANRIAKFNGVRIVWPVKSAPIPDNKPIWTGDAASSPPPADVGLRKRQGGDATPNDTFSPHLMTQVDKLREAGFTGKGIKIALVDTGIDYTHPALGGCFGPGCIVSYGRDYVGDYYDEFPDSKPEPDDDPYDGCNGHGTHTAGIIAAQENPFGFTGVAPGVELGAYRVCSCRGHVHEDIYLKGFNDAFEAGSDIISTSTLFNSDWKEDAAAILLSRIVKEGVPCIVPMGNSGQMGMFSTGSPAVASGVTAVGSVVNLEYPMLLKRAQWSIGEDGQKKDFGWAEGHFGNFGDTVKPLIYIPDAKDKSCKNYPGPDTPDLYGYVVLVDLDGCPLYNKTDVLMDHGARDIMTISPDFTTYEVRVYPLAVDGLGMVSRDQAQEWVDLLAKGEKVYLHMTYSSRAEDYVYSPINTVSRGYVGTTSSWGMGWELEIKPSFTAPGGNILSTWPRRLSLGYAVQSGTSMASPFAAGVYALIMEATGLKDPAAIENLLASNANPNLWFDGKDLHPGTLAPVPQQGAGIIQAYDAAMAKSFVSTSGISFNDSEHFIDSATITIENKNDKDVVYLLRHMAAVTIYTATEHQFLLATYPNPTSDTVATLEFSKDNITIPSGGKAEITVKPTPPSKDEVDVSRLPIYSGYIVINATSGESLSVPYVGVLGSMTSIPIVDTRPEVTYLQFWDQIQRLKPLKPGQKFTISEPKKGVPPSLSRNNPLPSALFQRQAGTAYITVLIEALDENNTLPTKEFMGTKYVGVLSGYPQEYVPRGISEEAFAGVLDDGTVVPNGKYQFVIKALKISGNRDKAADYQTVVVGPFELEYGTPESTIPDFAQGPDISPPLTGDFP